MFGDFMRWRSHYVEVRTTIVFVRSVFFSLKLLLKEVMGRGL
jgi:hypothetical protein